MEVQNSKLNEKKKKRFFGHAGKQARQELLWAPHEEAVPERSSRTALPT